MTTNKADAEKIAVYAARIRALEDLLVCYRMQRQPSERLHERLAETARFIDHNGLWRQEGGRFMTGGTPHKTAQQKAAVRSPLARAVDRGQLAPAVTVPPVVCAGCTHPRVNHRDNLKCLTVGCDCEAYRVADA